jgi:leucyl-tRNA synthetase
MKQATKSEDTDQIRQKYYVLTEFPYPSGSGLHVGHAFTMTGADVQARYKRMKGYDVLFPMGYDAFGLPTENYAIKSGISPQKATDDNTAMFRKQMDKMGFSFDWNREVNTTDPLYYRWTQWIFIKLYEHGLAEKQEMPINWCPSCKIGLANEEVIDGKCERCGAKTGQKTLSQWVLKITKYADRLIDGLPQTEFENKIKASQINWIGKKEGVKIRFEVVLGAESDTLEIFTSRPDTLMGATFVVIAPEHPLVDVAKKNQTDKAETIKSYVDEAKKRNEIERGDMTREKTGMFSGLYARHPMTGDEMPIWIADYVSMGYGTGAIMAVPSDDERDMEFAEKFDLPVNKTYTPDEEMLDKIIEKQVGETETVYHLNDWIFSRQHYWGEPIPMIDCPSCGWVSVPEDELPVVLPEVEAYQPTDTGESPLAGMTEWLSVKCPKCGGEARRETDTMPNWAGSNWYFLRYCDPGNDTRLADMDKMKHWLPVDLYIGGDEHTTLHLLYSRFIYQFLWDIGAVPHDYPEPYKKRISHGVILGPDGNRMSKSKGNIITPDVVVDKFGADVTRTYMMFMGPFDATMAWSDQALMGVKRFINKLVEYAKTEDGETSIETRSELHNLIKFVAGEIDQMKYNTAIAKIMGTLGDLLKRDVRMSTVDKRKLVLLMAPFAPFVTEELWTELRGDGSVHDQAWPVHNPDYIVAGEVKIAVQVNGKLRGVLSLSGEVQESEVDQKAREVAGKYLDGKKVIKQIYVAGKMMSYVTD